TPNWSNPDCCDAFESVADNTQVLYTVCCFGPPRGNRLFRRNPGMTGGGEIPNYPEGNLPGFKFPDVIARFGANRYGLITNSGIFATQNITAKTPTPEKPGGSRTFCQAPAVEAPLW